jgi:hypothetical protein
LARRITRDNDRAALGDLLKADAKASPDDPG